MQSPAPTNEAVYEPVISARAPAAGDPSKTAPHGSRVSALGEEHATPPGLAPLRTGRGLHRVDHAHAAAHSFGRQLLGHKHGHEGDEGACEEAKQDAVHVDGTRADGEGHQGRGHPGDKGGALEHGQRRDPHVVRHPSKHNPACSAPVPAAGGRGEREEWGG